MVRRRASSREPVFNVLHLARLVGVREPVLAHEHVVGEADDATGHEDLWDCKRRHYVRGLSEVEVSGSRLSMGIVSSVV